MNHDEKSLKFKEINILNNTIEYITNLMKHTKK